MIDVQPITAFLADQGPVLDVRSPAEFIQGHIPGAANLPLFTNEERATIGTLYKEEGRDAAMLQGLRCIGPRMAPFVETALDLAPDKCIAVHCWRGGERSASVAWLLDKAGFNQVRVLRGGYKAFRKHVLSTFQTQFDIRILVGYTGTGKTELLTHLRELGEHTIDLEALAHHKGSSYGSIGETAQPTTEHFENRLCRALLELKGKGPIWLEDESQLIGRAKIPDAFFEQMRNAPCYFVEMSREERAKRLVADYGKYPKELIADATRRIERRIGPQHCKAALEALDNDDLYTVAMIALTYYDKTYAFGLAKRDPDLVIRMTGNSADMPAVARQAFEHGNLH